MLQNSMVFLASHIPCPIPAFSHFLGLGYSGVFQRKKTLVSSILQEKGFEINADFYGKWELGLEQRPRKVQGMLSRASIHGDTFPPLQIPQIPAISPFHAPGSIFSPGF